MRFCGSDDDVLVEDMGNRDYTAVSRERRPKYLEWLRYIGAYLILTYGTRKLIHLVHEIFLEFLAEGKYFEYQIEAFDLDPDRPF